MSDSTSKPVSSPKKPTNDRRASRLEAELRANLSKRKQQKRLRAESPPAASPDDCDKEDT